MKIPLLLCLSVLLVHAATEEPTLAVLPTQQWSANLTESPGSESSAWRISDEHHWREFWTRDLNREPPTAPDFTRGSVLVVSGGVRPTGGYRLEVGRAVKGREAWIIEFVVHPPAPDRFVTQALTCPVAVVHFPRRDIIRPLVREIVLPGLPVPDPHRVSPR